LKEQRRSKDEGASHREGKEEFGEGREISLRRKRGNRTKDKKGTERGGNNGAY